LLDSLHEELNIRMNKPYIEKPDSYGRDEDELSIECWSNFLHRNWSFIAFIFFG
jgi:ubiquitin C-terminal hydrolase